MAEPGAKLQVGVAVIGVVGALGAAMIARGGSDKPAPAPVTQIQVIQNQQAVQVAPQTVIAPVAMAPVVVAEAAPAAAAPGGRACWSVTQLQRDGSSYRGELALIKNGGGVLGSLRWDGHPQADVSGKLAGSTLRLVIRYPNGLAAEYDAILGADGALRDGTSRANNGDGARWSALPVDCQ